ncbi:hypothetical protein ASF50_15765 [Nocardioides sp. Leaf307]|nr:hypothetical protein ASF50_15765 [Nocardioides sp. Leaf307]
MGGPLTARGSVGDEGLRPVDGATGPRRPPVLTTGRYRDRTVEPASQNIYSVRRTLPGSTVVVGATVTHGPGGQGGQGAPAGTGAPGPGRLTVLLGYPRADGGGFVPCGRSDRSPLTRAARMPLSTDVAWSAEARGCPARAELRVAVFAVRTSGVPVGSAYELDVWEVPAPGGTSLPEPAPGAGAHPDPGVATTTVVAAASPATAPVLEPGAGVHVALARGRVGWLGVPVGVGEELAVRADVDPLPGRPAAELALVGPAGGLASPPDAGSRGRAGPGPLVLGADGAVVTPASRAGGDPGAGAASEPGVHLVALWVAGSGTAEVTVTTAAVPGAPRTGAGWSYAGPPRDLPLPTGASPAAWPGARGDVGAAGPADASGESAARTPAVPGRTVGGVALLLGAVALGGAGTVLLRRARRR